MNIKYMNMAIEQAKCALKQDEIPIGAIIVKNDKVIGCGYNLKEKNNDPTAHAEIIAIKEATKKISNWRLDGCDIYITVEPCPMCASAIKQSRIDCIYYLHDSKNVNNMKIVMSILNDDFSNKITKIQKIDIENNEINLLSNFFEKKY